MNEPPGPTPTKRPTRTAYWILVLALGGCATAACAAAPHVGWVGWVLIALVLFGGC